MMAKLGFKQGSTLGAKGNMNARLEPLGVEVKEDRGGVGLDSERKRKIREDVEGETKRVKAKEKDYRERVAKEKNDRRLEGLVGEAMRIAERMDEDERSVATATSSRNTMRRREQDESGENALKASNSSRLLKQINVLWRGLAKQRVEKERQRRMRYSLHQNLSQHAIHLDREEERANLAWGEEEEEVEEEDADMDEFDALEPAERLRKLVVHLRDTYNYCFWCKYRYLDSTMDGCPGLTEDDHD